MNEEPRPPTHPMRELNLPPGYKYLPTKLKSSQPGVVFRGISHLADGGWHPLARIYSNGGFAYFDRLGSYIQMHDYEEAARWVEAMAWLGELK